MKRMIEANDLDKYTFIYGNFNFQMDDTLENVSKTPEYKGIVSILNRCLSDYTIRPVIICDTADYNDVYIGMVSDDGYIYACNVKTASTINYLELQYDREGDSISVTKVEEELATTDNLKTLFGNKSIIGSGNIDIYNHFITLTSASGNYYLNYFSSNNLVVDSLQDLTTVTKAKANTKVAVDSTYIIYSSNVWKLANNEAITAVSDVVTTI